MIVADAAFARRKRSITLNGTASHPADRRLPGAYWRGQGRAHLQQGQRVQGLASREFQFDLLRRRCGRDAFVHDAAHEQSRLANRMACHSRHARFFLDHKKDAQRVARRRHRSFSIKKEIFEQVIYENSMRNFIEHDFEIVHDPQPLPLIEHYEKSCPWLWRCHLDLSRPDAETWKYLRHWIDNYDAVILSCRQFAQEMNPPQRVMMPAIDPFTIKNRQLSD